MPKINRKLKILLIGFVVLIGVAALGYWTSWWVLSSKWKTEFKTDQISQWTNEIKNTPPTPDNFMSVFNALHPHAHKNTVKRIYPDYLYEALLGLWPRRPWGNQVYSIRVSDLILSEVYDRNPSMLDRSFVLACGLETFVSPEECCNYFLNNVRVQYPLGPDTLLVIKGIEGLSQFKFDKNISQLSEDEILEVIIAFDKNEKKFDPYYNPELFKKRLQVLKRIIDGNRMKE